MDRNKVRELGQGDDRGIRCRGNRDRSRLCELSGAWRMVAVHCRHKERDGGRADRPWKDLEGVAPKARNGPRPNDMRRSMFSLLARLCLLQRRETWRPTILGWLCLTLLFAVPMAWWCSNGELFLSSTRRL